MVFDFFNKTKLPNNIPNELKEIIKQVNQSKNQEEALKKAYHILTKRFYGKKFVTYLLFHRLFYKDPQRLWDNKGFLHCTNFNYLIRIILVNSKFFKEKDIQLKWTFIFISPHQYLLVNLNNKKITLDAWAANYDIKFGDIMSTSNSTKKKT